MRRHRDRQLKAIEDLYARRFAHFLQVSRAITGDRERAQEAVQDAFVDLIRAKESFRGDGSLEAYAWRIVTNAAKKATRRPLVEVRELRAGQIESDEPPAAVLHVAPLVAALPERQRLAVFLRYYADLDYATIATTLGLEPGSVGPTLAAARSSIRERLGEEVRHG